MINVAVVGLGWCKHVCNVLGASRKLRVVRGIELNPGPVRSLAKKHGFELTSDYKDALKDPNVDGVILTTPHSTHEKLVLQAVKAGKQVFCEKPLSLTSASAKRMVKACADKKLVLGLGHERRYEPAMEELVKMVKAGKLGKILAVEGNFSHDKFEGLTKSNWRGSKTDAPAAGWTGMGVHLTDLFISMLGPVQEIRATSAKRVLNLPSGDVVSTQFSFADKTMGTINVISATPFYARLTVFGDQGWVDIHEMSHPENPGETHMYICNKNGKRRRKVFQPVDTVKKNFEAWADAVSGKKPYRFTNEQRIANVAVLEALAKSANAGGTPQKVKN